MRYLLQLMLLVFFLISCGEDEPEINKPSACSPSNFDDYNQFGIIEEDCFIPIVSEGFSDVNNTFERGQIGNSDVFISNGRLNIENVNGQSVVRCLGCANHRVDNFQIDLEFTIDSFIGEYSGIKIAWGGQPEEVLEKSFRIGMNCFPRYDRFENIGRWQFGTGWTDTDSHTFINWPGSNVLTIRNVLPETFFFINGILAGKVDRAVLDDHREIALIVSGDIDVSIDRFEYREITR